MIKWILLGWVVLGLINIVVTAYMCKYRAIEVDPKEPFLHGELI